MENNKTKQVTGETFLFYHSAILLPFWHKFWMLISLVRANISTLLSSAVFHIQPLIKSHYFSHFFHP